MMIEILNHATKIQKFKNEELRTKNFSLFTLHFFRVNQYVKERYF